NTMTRKDVPALGNDRIINIDGRVGKNRSSIDSDGERQNIVVISIAYQGGNKAGEPCSRAPLRRFDLNGRNLPQSAALSHKIPEELVVILRAFAPSASLEISEI